MTCPHYPNVLIVSPWGAGPIGPHQAWMIIDRDRKIEPDGSRWNIAIVRTAEDRDAFYASMALNGWNNSKALLEASNVIGGSQ